jgi:hypothetical protein
MRRERRMPAFHHRKREAPRGKPVASARLDSRQRVSRVVLHFVLAGTE